MFVLVSSRPVAPENILSIYSSRQGIEQASDFGKVCASLPLRCIQTADALNGHLLLTFLATALHKLVRIRLKDTPCSPPSLFLNLRNQKCKVYDNAVLPQEPAEKANDAYKLLGLSCPRRIPRHESSDSAR